MTGRARAAPLLFVLALLGMSVLVAADGQSALSSTICGIVNGVQNIVGVLALVLFMVGGVMYMISHFIPTSVKFREELQGWSTSMMIGGLIGLIVVIVAPEIVGFFEGVAVGAAGVSGFTQTSCGGAGGSTQPPSGQGQCVCGETFYACAAQNGGGIEQQCSSCPAVCPTQGERILCGSTIYHTPVCHKSGASGS